VIPSWLSRSTARKVSQKPLDNTLYKVYIIFMSGKELVKKLKKDGWIEDRINSSHHILIKNGITLSVPVHGNEDLKPGILNSLLKKTGYK
jgi:predicted RNA binding protein YcfA (HicA-like mRNA interferase family)